MAATDSSALKPATRRIRHRELEQSSSSGSTIARIGIPTLVTPQDVKTVGPDVLRHRIAVSYEAEAEEMTSEHIIEQIFAGLPVP